SSSSAASHSGQGGEQRSLKSCWERKASSSIGRAAVSKTAGWGFETLLACQPRDAVCSALREPSPKQSMETKVANQPTFVDTPKLVLASGIVLIGFVAYYYFGDASVLLRALA